MLPPGPSHIRGLSFEATPHTGRRSLYRTTQHIPGTVSLQRIVLRTFSSFSSLQAANSSGSTKFPGPDASCYFKVPLLLFIFCNCNIVNSVFGEGNGTPLQSSCLENPIGGGAWWAAVHGVAKSQARLNNFTFTFHFHALEKEMAPHSSVLAWRIPGTGEPGGLPSMGSRRVGHD